MSREMFYEQKCDNALRFGDVIRGYVNINTTIKGPILDYKCLNESYTLDIGLPQFCVVLSPCCSIGENIISLTPLIKVHKAFFYNPHFAEDLTIINRKMNPEQTLPPKAWETLLTEEKEKRLKEGFTYASVALFIYEKNDLFEPYLFNIEGEEIETKYYMIDFRNIYKINCNKIISPKKSPLESKCLQLSIQARSELRDKIAYYFARVPEEDQIFEE